METNDERIEAKVDINNEMNMSEKKRIRLNTIYRVIVTKHKGANRVAPYARVADEAEQELFNMGIDMTVTASHVKECVRLLNSKKCISGMNTSDRGVYYDNGMEAQLANITEKCERVLAMKYNVSALLSNFIRDFGAENVPTKIYDFVDQFGGLSIEEDEDAEA